MRVRLIFGLNNRGGFVPFHHQFLLAEFIESTIQNECKEFAQFFGYNYSGLKGQTKVGKNGLHFYSSKVTLVLSSQSKDFIDSFLKAVFSKKQVEIGKLELTPEHVEIEKVPEFKDNTKFICISPLVIASPFSELGKSKQFINPTEDDFSDQLYEGTMERLEESENFSEEEIASYFKFQIDPDRVYLNKIKANEKKFSRIYPVFMDGNKMEIRGYTFPFIFYIDPKVQQFVFETGFGELTHKGFGMLDVANVDPVGRAKPYSFE